MIHKGRRSCRILPRVGLDLAKNVFQIHGADSAGRAVLRKKLRRAQVLEFFSQLPSCVVAMEAGGGAHFWGREIGKPGHEVRLIPPAYVKPFVKRQKNDTADAEAICEAALRPTMYDRAGDARIAERAVRASKERRDAGCGNGWSDSIEKYRPKPQSTKRTKGGLKGRLVSQETA